MIRRLVLAGTSILVLSACPSSDPGPNPDSGTPACTSASDCPSGLDCSSQVCVVPIPVVNCPAPVLVSKGMLLGHDAAPTTCQKPIASSALPASRVQSKGTHAVGEKLTFDVASGTGSVSIVAQAVKASASVVSQGKVIENAVLADHITQPDGKEIFNDNAPVPRDPSGVQVFFGGGSGSTGATVLPNAAPLLSQVATGGLQAGKWSFNVSDFAYECSQGGCDDGGVVGNTYDVTVLTKPMPTATGTAALDVAFYLVGTSALTSATAPDTATIQRMVRTLAGYYKGAGICIGNVEFWDVPAWAKNRFGASTSADETDPCSNLDQMFALSQPENTINFFLVQSINQSSTGSGGTVVGIDGTIPGPSTIGGTIHSGAAVSMADLNRGPCGSSIDLSGCGPDIVAYIAAHEGGHFLGLFHTTESDGEYFDPIADTAKCPCETCALASDQANCATEGKKPPPAVPAYVHSSRCVSQRCSGGDNLMFWDLGPGSQGSLSAQQSLVMRLNPAVQ